MNLFKKVVVASVSFFILQGCVVVAPVMYVPYEPLDFSNSSEFDVFGVMGAHSGSTDEKAELGIDEKVRIILDPDTVRHVEQKISCTTIYHNSAMNLSVTTEEGDC